MELAEHYLSRAFESDPTFGNIAGQLGTVLFKKGDYEGARAKFHAAVSGGAHEYHVNLGGFCLTLDNNATGAEHHLLAATNNNLAVDDFRRGYIFR